MGYVEWILIAVVVVLIGWLIVIFWKRDWRNAWRPQLLAFSALSIIWLSRYFRPGPKGPSTLDLVGGILLGAFVIVFLIVRRFWPEKVFR